MMKRLILTGAMILAGAMPAAAWEQSLFDFKGEFPVPGGSLRLETRCAREAEGIRCRLGSLGPAGRGFQFEGRLLIWPQAPTVSSDPGPQHPPQTGPRWF